MNKRNSLFRLLLVLFVLTLGASRASSAAPATPAAAPPATEAEKELRAANAQFYSALNAMFTGDLAPMNAIWSHKDDVTDLGPFGGRLVGWTAVGEEFKKEAALKLGGKVVCTELLVVVGTDLGYTVCVEQGENMSADGKPVVVKHRATNIFRRENGQWKLAHHHTDLSPQLEAATGTAK